MRIFTSLPYRIYFNPYICTSYKSSYLIIINIEEVKRIKHRMPSSSLQVPLYMTVRLREVCIANIKVPGWLCYSLKNSLRCIIQVTIMNFFLHRIGVFFFTFAAVDYFSNDAIKSYTDSANDLKFIIWYKIYAHPVNFKFTA